ncbi:hypothetical protein IJT93_10595 [bacterium]|nr:hypothetical protein [bacterium]
MTHSSSGDLLCLRLEIDAKRNGKKTVIWEDPDSNKKIEPLKSDGVTGGSYECKDKDCGLDMRLYFRRK